MREIKFRAWHKEHKLMFEVFGFDVNTIYPWQRECDPEIPIAPDAEDCTLMQYTGLKDKNGKEIYEGDIVETKYSYYRIYYFNGHWFAENDFLSDVLLEPECNIVGNIYENPELVS